MEGRRQAAVRKKSMAWWRILTLPVQNLRMESLKWVQTISAGLIQAEVSYFHEQNFNFHVIFSKLLLFFFTITGITGFHKQFFLPTNISFISSERQWFQVVKQLLLSGWIKYVLVGFYWHGCAFIFSEQNHRLCRVAWMTWQMNLHKRYFLNIIQM